jgi:hypothetical protein
MADVHVRFFLHILQLFWLALVCHAGGWIPGWDTTSQAVRLVLPASTGSYAWLICSYAGGPVPCVGSSQSSSASKYWTVMPTSSSCQTCWLLRNAMSGKCIQATSATNGASLTMATCSASNTLQQWAFIYYTCTTVPAGLSSAECGSNLFFTLSGTSYAIQRTTSTATGLQLATWSSANLKLHTVITSPGVDYVNNGVNCIYDSDCHSGVCTSLTCCSGAVAQCSSCSSSTGACTGCYTPYALNNGQCAYQPSGGGGGDPASTALEGAATLCKSNEGACWGLTGFGMFLLATTIVYMAKECVGSGAKFNPCLPQESVHYMCGCGGAGFALILIGSGMAAAGMAAGLVAGFIIVGVLAAVGPALPRMCRETKVTRAARTPSSPAIEFAELNPVPMASSRNARVGAMTQADVPRKFEGASV